MADFTQEQLDEAVKKGVEAATGKMAESIKKLEANNAALVEEKRVATGKAKEEQAKAVAAAEAKARNDGDFEAMDASWKKKYADLEAQSKAANEEQSGIISKLTAGADNLSISAEIGLKGSEAVLAQLLESRVTSSIVDGVAKTVYVDKDGKPSAATREEFIAEIKGNAAYAPLLAGSNGSGGGAAGQSSGGGEQSKIATWDEWNQMGTADRSKFSNDGGKLE